MYIYTHTYAHSRLKNALCNKVMSYKNKNNKSTFETFSLIIKEHGNLPSTLPPTDPPPKFLNYHASLATTFIISLVAQTPHLSSTYNHRNKLALEIKDFDIQKRLGLEYAQMLTFISS